MSNRRSPAYRVVQVLLIVELTWLILGNLFLNSGFGPLITNIKPEKFTMAWASGWTLYPGQVNASEIVINIHTWSTDVEIRGDKASANLRVLPLLLGRLTIANLQGGTASINVQRERPEGERPPPSKPYPGLTIAIPEAEVQSVDRFVFNQLVFTGGDATARGSASFQIRGDKVLSGITAHWNDAHFDVGNEEFSETLSASFTGGMSAFNPRVDRGLALAEKVSGHLILRGHVGTLSPLEIFFPDADWIESIDGVGDVDIDVDIQHGELQPGAVIDIDAHDLEFNFLGISARGQGRVDGRVAQVEDKRAGEIQIIFDEFGLTRGSKEPLVLGQGMVLTTRASNLGLVNAVNDLEIALDIPDSHFPDVSVFGSYLPESLGVTIADGSAALKASLLVEGPERLATGQLSVAGKDLEGAFRDTEFSMDFSLETALSGEQLNDFEFGIHGSKIRFYNGIFDNDKVEVDDNWWMNIDVPHGKATLSSPARVAGSVDLAMKDTRAIIALFAEVKQWVAMFNRLLTVNDVQGSANIEITQGQMRIKALDVSGDKLQLKAEVAAREGKNDAIVWGKLGLLSAGFQRQGKNTSWKMANGRAWFDNEVTNNWRNRCLLPVEAGCANVAPDQKSTGIMHE